MSSQPPPRRGTPPGARRSAGVTVARPFGIPLVVAPSWFLVAGVVTVLAAPTFAGATDRVSTTASYVLGLCFVVLLYVSVVVHELSHSLVARALGIGVRRITIHLLGGVSELEREPATPAREYLVAMAGPLVSLLLAGAGLAGAAALADGSIPELLVGEVAISNGVVAAFNLLPASPLDGGKVLHAAVWGATGDTGRAGVVTAWVGRALALLLVGVPVTVAAALGSDLSTLTVLWLGVLAAFVWTSSTRALALTRLRARVPSVSVRALVRRALPVAPDLSVAEAVRRAGVDGARGLVVVDGAGRPLGVVSESRVRDVPDAQRPWTLIGSLSRPLEHGMLLRADLTGEALLETLARTPASEYLVMDPLPTPAEGDRPADAGCVLGVLTVADVARAVEGGTA